MPEHYYQFRTNHHGFATRLFLNGILIDSDPDGIFKKRNLLCNQFIIGGVNTVRLEIGLVNPPSLPKELALEIGLYQLSEQQLSSDQLSEPLVKLEFPGSEVPSFPAALEAPVSIDSELGRWRWEDAEPVEELASGDIQSISTLVADIHAALSNRELGRIQQLMEVKTVEMARAYHIPMADRVADQEQFFRDIFNDSQFAMEPLSLEELRAIPMAEHRYFTIERADGKALVESVELSEGFCFNLPVAVSKISGKWIVVR